MILALIITGILALVGWTAAILLGLVAWKLFRDLEGYDDEAYAKRDYWFGRTKKKIQRDRQKLLSLQSR